MFRDRTDFYAVLLSGEAFSDIRRLTRNLAVSDFVLESSELERDPEKIEIHYGYVHSAIPYVRSPEKRDAIAVKLGTREMYRFDTYIVAFEGMCLVALPFLGLLKEVLTALEGAVRGDVPYRAVDLQAMIPAVLRGEHLDGKLRLRALDFDVRGDNDVTRLLFRGDNTLYSKTYARIIPALKKITLVPRACLMSYDDHEGNRISLEADRFGNFGFRVAVDARNLGRLRFLLRYLLKGRFLVPTHVKPTRRLDDAAIA